jgi:hypothetical protein
MNEWVNLHEYTPVELFFNGLGCLFWLFAYVVLLARIIRKRFVEMPVLVAGANFGWEIAWSSCFHPSTGRLFAWMYAGAALLDVVIFGSVLRFGPRQFAKEPRKRTFQWLCALNLFFWFLICYWARAEGLDDELGARSGYVINVILSYTSLALMLRLSGSYSFSTWLGVFRGLGTGCISISVALIYPQSHFLHALCAACWVLDAAFVATLALGKIRESRVPIRWEPHLA